MEESGLDVMNDQMEVMIRVDDACVFGLIKS